MNKKGTLGFDVINTIPRLIYTIVCIAIIVLMARTFFMINDTSSSDVEIRGISERFYFSGITYQDQDTKRIYPGEIDISKFNENKIQQTLCYDEKECSTNKHVAAKLTLNYSNKEKTVVLNEFNYKNWKILSDTKFEGFGQIKKGEYSYPVLVKTKNESIQGTLKTIILMEK